MMKSLFEMHYTCWLIIFSLLLYVHYTMGFVPHPNHPINHLKSINRSQNFLSTHIPPHNFAINSKTIDKKEDFKLIPDKDPNNMKDPDGYKKFIVPLIVAVVALAFGVAMHKIDVSGFLEQAVKRVEELGPYGYLYFAAVYIAAELLAIPAFPLTASCGYLFGLLPGTLLVILSATIAASISFFIGRTYLRSWAQNFIQSSPTWKAYDKAIAKEGFKVILLLRLSPLLPFALSNYIYAVTSVDFISFITATFLGFTPGTFGIVYFGSAGKAFFSSENTLHLPWYGYAAAGFLVVLIAQTIGKIATDALKNMEQEDDSNSNSIVKDSNNSKANEQKSR